MERNRILLIENKMQNMADTCEKIGVSITRLHMAQMRKDFLSAFIRDQRSSEFL